MQLKRQLRRLGLSEDTPPDAAAWRAFLDRVRSTYAEADQDRYTIEHTLVVLSDEMRALYDGLRRSEANFKVVVERSPDAIFVRREGVIRYANPAMARLLGFERGDELIGRTAVETFVHPDDRARVIEHRARILDGTAGPLRARWVRTDGTVLTVEAVSAHVTFDDEPAVVTIVRDETEGLQAEAERQAALVSLRVSEERYRVLFERSPLAIMLFEPTSLRILAANEAASRLYGYERDELLTLRVSDLRASEDPEPLLGVALTPEADSERPPRPSWHGTKKHRKKDGTTFDVDISTHPVNVGGQLAVLAIGADVTERRRLVQERQHAKKMEAVGCLAGGIAHDFNNLLTVILSYSNMLIQSGALDPLARGDMKEVRSAGERASKLTQQLLAFGRKQILKPEIVDVSDVVSGIQRMVAPLLGENVRVAIRRPERPLPPIFADPSQVELVLMNLVLNARDAMSGSGTIVVETRAVDYKRGALAEAGEAASGRYTRLRVSDHGVGMDTSTRERVFEPFFTTKGAGKGTGLGLATVFGIVKQSGGFITVESELGRGATFDVYFPCVDSVMQTGPSSIPSPAVIGGTETILVVEDDPQVRGTIHSILGRIGYKVIEAQNAGEAFLIFEKRGADIDLVVTDVMMPHMNGPELVDRLLAMRAETKVLYVSGYADDAATYRRLGDPSVAFMQKPLTPNALARKIREVLGSGSAGE